MYVPPHFRESRVPILHEAIAHLSFGTLVTVADGTLHASHVPMTVDPLAGPSGTVIGHIARNNPQWHAPDPAIAALATFVGPHFYVPPSWYASKTETGKVVPTWNYIAIQARGPVTFFDDRTQLAALVARLTDQHEGRREQPWSTDDAPAAYIEAMLGAIIGFELRIESLEGAWKLGQQKSDADRAGIAAGVAREHVEPAIRALLPLLAPSPRDDGA